MEVWFSCDSDVLSLASILDSLVFVLSEEVDSEVDVLSDGVFVYELSDPDGVVGVVGVV